MSQYVQILDVPECNLVLGQVKQFLTVSLEMLDKVKWQNQVDEDFGEVSVCDQKCHQLSHAALVFFRCRGIILACQLKKLLS